jgi:hypothetical protein
MRLHSSSFAQRQFARRQSLDASCHSAGTPLKATCTRHLQPRVELYILSIGSRIRPLSRRFIHSGMHRSPHGTCATMQRQTTFLVDFIPRNPEKTTHPALWTINFIPLPLRFTTLPVLCLSLWWDRNAMDVQTLEKRIARGPACFSSCSV